jgi:Enoyl-(Acyl carrier protein) reductase
MAFLQQDELQCDVRSALYSMHGCVNPMAPGPVDTAMAVHTPAVRADYHDAIPLNRYGLEAELAEAVFLLCSDRASYITGQMLSVDGGFESTGIGLPTMRGGEEQPVYPMRAAGDRGRQYANPNAGTA